MIFAGTLTNTARFEGDEESDSGIIVWMGERIPVKKQVGRWVLPKKSARTFNNLLGRFRVNDEGQMKHAQQSEKLMNLLKADLERGAQKT